MDNNISTNDGEAGEIDYKAKVLAVYPEATCIEHGWNRAVKPDGITSCRYFDVWNGDVQMARNTYWEYGAWQNAWYYIQNEMLKKLES